MGTIIPPPEFGANCINFSIPAETPKYLYVFFWDVKKGAMGGAVQPPNGHIFTLTQKPGSACVWESWNAAHGWWVQFGIDALKSWLWLGDDNLFPNYYFVNNTGSSPPSEYDIYDNEYVAPGGNYGYNGHGTVFWMSSVISQSVMFGLYDSYDLKLEVFPANADKFVNKFCSLLLRANVLIKFSP